MKPLSRIHEILLDLDPGTIPEPEMTTLIDELRRALSEYTRLKEECERSIEGEEVCHSLLDKSPGEMVERYRALFDYAGIPMVMVDTDGIITLANARFLEYTTIPLQDLVGRISFFSLIDPRDRETIRQYHQACKKHETMSSRYETRFSARFPSVRYVSLSISLMPGGSETLISLYDITEKRRQKAELAAHNKRLEILLTLNQMTSEPESVVTAYSIQKGIELTASTMGFLGFIGTEPDVITIEAFWPEKNGWIHEESLLLRQLTVPLDDLPYVSQVVRTGEALILDSNPHATRVLTSMVTHPVYYQRAMIVPVIDENRVVAVACVADKPENYDTSDQMQLAVLMAGMWRLIIRNRHEDTLQAANKKLGLLSSLSRHDIINLLTALDGYIELSAEIATEPELISYISKEKEISGSIADIIAFTREYEMVGIHTPVWQEVTNIFDEVVRALPLSGITVQSETAGLWVYADPLMIRVFSNFIDNSLRHGGEISWISLSWEYSGEDLLLIYQDNGAGISWAEKEKIFIRGYGKHTGLGLFLIREIFSITGISIRETGDPGTGVRFEMRIPRGGYRILTNPENPGIFRKKPEEKRVP